MKHAESFRDLVVYQYSREVAKEIFLLTQKFPKEEQFSLNDQMRRSSRSIGAQVAESWAKRRYVKHFISKLTDSNGEQLETQHWIDTALDCGYIDINRANVLNERLDRIGRMLNSMINKADAFCGNTYDIKENIEPYFITNDTNNQHCLDEDGTNNPTTLKELRRAGQ